MIGIIYTQNLQFLGKFPFEICTGYEIKTGINSKPDLFFRVAIILATMLHAFMYRSIFTLHTLLGIVGVVIINFYNFGNAIYLVFTKLDVKFDFLTG